MALEKLLFSFDFQLENIERKQQDSIEIVKCLSSLGKECVFSKLLEYHMNIINDCDNEMQEIILKKKMHEELKEDWDIYTDCYR